MPDLKSQILFPDKSSKIQSGGYRFFISDYNLKSFKMKTENPLKLEV